MSYISHVDYKKMMDGFKKGAPKQMLKESLDPVGKEDSDIDNDGDTDKTDKYLASRRQAIGQAIGKGRAMKESHPENDKWYEDFENGLQNLVKNGYIHKNMYQYFHDALDHIDPMDNYSHLDGHDAAKEFVDDLRTKDAIEADKAQFARETGLEESGTGDESFDFNKAAIESASGDKVGHVVGRTRHDDYGRAIYYSLKNPDVSYYIGDLDQIIKRDTGTGERYQIGDLKNYDEPTPDYDDDYDEYPADHGDPGADFNDGEFWEAEMKKLQEIAGVKPQDDGPEDDDEEAREKKAKKMEMDDEEAENAEREDEGLNEGAGYEDPYTLAKAVAQAHPELQRFALEDRPMFQRAAFKYANEMMAADGVSKVAITNLINGFADEDWPSDYISALGQELEAMTESLNERNKYSEIIPALKAKGIKYGMPEKEIIRAIGQVMQEIGFSNKEIRYHLSYEEDFIPDLLQDLKDSEKDIEEGLHMPPLQATGPTVSTNEGMHMPPLQATGQTIVTNEDQAPFGMSVLSPDERKQLREYINSYRTIKNEISKLLSKTGKTGEIMENAKKVEDETVPAERKAKYKDPTTVPTQHKHSNLGGDRTNLVMTKAEMWENEEHEEGAHERIESLLDTKLHDAFHKVTGMVIKDLMDGGFDEGDIKNFLQHEIDEKAKEAINAQHDF